MIDVSRISRILNAELSVSVRSIQVSKCVNEMAVWGIVGIKGCERYAREGR
jgi:hypothetical protein